VGAVAANKNLTIATLEADMIKRRQILQKAAVALAALPVLASTRNVFASTQSGAGAADEKGQRDADLSQIERNKQLVRKGSEERQRQAIPPTLPGAKELPPFSLGSPNASESYSCQDPPGGVDDPKAVWAAVAGWHVQSTGPSILSYGPMIAENDSVLEEWESFFHGLDGSMYSNHYCSIIQIKDGAIAKTREYIDSHHAFIVLGLHAPWKALEPPRAPRRRWRGFITAPEAANTVPLTEMETVFPVRQEYNLPTSMLRDVTPTANLAQRFPDTLEGNKALVRAMRDAQAKGDAAAVDSLHGKGFRHFVAGEGPLGWEHIPFKDLYAPLVKHLAGPIKVRFSKMVAEGGSVFEEMDILARLDDGTVYNNWHCFIHEIRGGQIVQTREYMDTHHLWVVLGRWAEWGKTPVPPLRQARRSNMPYVAATYQSRNPFLKIDRFEPLPPVKS
jgi:ketosteroid isomerase-like protein